MTTLTESLHAGGFIASEANGFLSRKAITILSGQNLAAGAVLGCITIGAATAAAVAGNTGNGTCGAVTVGAGAKVGVYRVICIEPNTNLGKFTVEDPDGITVGVATVASAFSGGGLAFTIADGATDFVSGDAFTITVAAGSGKYAAYDTALTNGRATAAGILFDAVDASSADKAGVAIVRLAEVVSSSLIFASDQDSTAQTAALAHLAALNIVAR